MLLAATRVALTQRALLRPRGSFVAVRRLRVTASVSERSSSADATAPALGVGFSAGGLLFPYYVGVVEALVQAEMLDDTTRLAGASAGSLIAAAVAAKVPTNALLDALKVFSDDVRTHGARGRLKEALDKTLLAVLPGNAYELANKRGLYVAVSRFTGTRVVGDLHSSFESNDDLCRCLLASCHIPLYFDGVKMGTRYRGAWVCDGGVTNFLPVPPGVQHVVRVCCFPAYSAAAALGAPGLIDIAPDSPDASGAPVDAPYSTARMLQWALTPADDATMDALRQRGAVDTLRWVERHREQQREVQEARREQTRAPS
jgi:hypothetical protein